MSDKNGGTEVMKKLLFAITAALTLLTATAFPQMKVSGRVVDVLDGKTVVIEVPTNSNRIVAQLDFIEVPEPGQELHQIVRDHLRKLTMDRDVNFVANILERNRMIGQLYLGSVDLSQQMVRDGAAWFAVPEKARIQRPVTEAFELIEAQAKIEKLGVWSISNLQPAWEYREAVRAAEEAEWRRRYQKVSNAQRPPEEKKAVEAPKAAATKPSTGIWANISGPTEKPHLGILGLYSGYNSAERTGYIYTGGSYLELAAKTPLEKIEFRTLYGYLGDQAAVEKSGYLLGFLTTSKAYQFAVNNTITVVADKRTAASGKAIRMFAPSPDGVNELLLLRVSKGELEKIMNSTDVTIKIGKVSGKASDESLELMKKLVNTSN
jgi:endonuclease YncB( thermonuclease family)